MLFSLKKCHPQIYNISYKHTEGDTKLNLSNIMKHLIYQTICLSFVKMVYSQALNALESDYILKLIIFKMHINISKKLKFVLWSTTSNLT